MTVYKEMVYDELLERARKAEIRGNSELAKELIYRANEIKSAKDADQS